MDEPKLFSGIKFTTGHCYDTEDIKTKLIDGGAMLINYLSEHVTHVIADKNCPKAEEARDLYDKPVVKSLWVRLCLKAKKLLPTEAFSPSRNIFQHVNATFSSDLSSNDIDVLAATLTFYGGRVSKDVVGSTHFIVPSTESKDLTEKLSSKQELKLVAPDWVLDSVKQNQCCDENLYDPKLLLPQPPPSPPPPPPPAPAQQNVTPQSQASQPPPTSPVVQTRLQFQQNASVPNSANTPVRPIRIPLSNQGEPRAPSARMVSPSNISGQQVTSLKASPNSYNSHAPSRVLNQQSMLTQPKPQAQQVLAQQQQQPQTQMINRIQDSPTHMNNPQRPYQVCLQPQPVNSNYHQPNTPRQSLYYPQGPNQMQMRMQSPPIRHTAQNEPQIVYDNFNHPHNPQDSTAPHQMQYQQHPPQQNFQQQNISPQPLQQQPPGQVVQTRLQYQQGEPTPNLAGTPTRPVRIPFGNQGDARAPGTRMVSPSQISGQQTVSLKSTTSPYNSHAPPRGPTQQSMLSQQQPQAQQPPAQMMNRNQDPNTLINSPQRPYQVCLQPQPVNSNYHQPNAQRQTLYYPQGANQMQMRMQSPPIRHTTQNEPQIVYDNFNHPQESSTPHQQMQYQQHSSQQNFQQQNISPQSQPQPSSPVVQTRLQFQQNTPAPNLSGNPVRPIRTPFSNQGELKAPSARMANPSQMSMQQTVSLKATTSNQPQPHPSIFDHRQESSLAQIKSKVPIVNESIDYFGHDTKEVLPRDLPLTGCVFKLIEHVDINSKLKDKWFGAIKAAGGLFSENLGSCTHLICETRLSPIYLEAMKLKVRCVTIYWVNDVLAQDRMTFPWKALHLPVPFSKNNRPLLDQIITTTNFKGKDRREVKEMILKLGARYTEYFSPSNTLIVCQSVGGEKYERAIEWKIPIANCHLLDDILLTTGKNLKLMLTQSKYQLFNSIDPLKLASYENIRDLMKPWTEPIVIAENKNSTASNLVNGDVKTSKVSQNSNDDSGIVTGGSNNSDTEVSNKAAAKSSHLPINGKGELADEKNELQVSKINNEQDQTKIKALSPSKESEEKQAVRKARKSTDPIKLLFTHLEPSLFKRLETYATKLGLDFSNTSTNCTHLVVDRISRTPKFICAFSHANHILSYKWLVESHEANQILDERPFILQDKEGEEKYSFNLIYSLVKRKKRAGLLFSNYIFFVTPSVLADIPSLKEMIESAGGVMTTKKLPAKMQLIQMKTEGKHFVVVTCNEDLHLCSTLDSYGVDLVSVEFVISGILRQDIDFAAHRLRTNLSKQIDGPSIQSPMKKLKFDESLS